MKLQKVFSRKLNKKEYVKWLIIVPPKNITELNWQDGQKLKSSVEKGNLVVTMSKEPSYSEFKNKVFTLLSSRAEGFIWPEIKERIKFEPKVPNNKWVRRLEQEIGLKRIKHDGIVHWYLDKKGITIYTIGYEGRGVGELVRLLKKNSIKGLVDVRELALSRKNGFSKSTLSVILKENGIVYRHFQELGSPRALRHELWNQRNYPEFFKKYSEWLNSPDAKTYLEDLEGLAHVRTTAIMCFEKDVEKCHRSIIKQRLIRDGFRVVDL